MRRRMVTLVREQRGPDWALERRDALAAPPGRAPGLDRVGPLGGQVLGGSATGTFKLQGVLEFSNPVSTWLADRLATRAVVLLFWIRCSGLAWPQAGCEQVLGGDSPEPTLTGMGLGCWWAVGKRPAARWRRIVEADTPHSRAASAIVRFGRDHRSASSREAVRVAPARGGHHRCSHPELAPCCA
jgi:hypothetical protein